MGKIEGQVDLPMGRLPTGNRLYAREVQDALQKRLYATRRARFEELVTDAGGASEFIRALSKRVERRADLSSSVNAFLDATYVSRARKGKKNIGESPADALEALFDKPKGWMSRTDQDQAKQEEYWPFGFTRELWDELDGRQKKEAERAFELILKGMQEVPAAPARRKVGTR